MDYIDRINQIIKKKGISQRKLAEMLGKPQGTIHNYLTRKTKMDIETLQKIAQLLDTDINYLLGFEGSINPEVKSVIYELVNDKLKLAYVNVVVEMIPDFFTKPKAFNDYDKKLRFGLTPILRVLLEFSTAPCELLKKVVDMEILLPHLFFLICYARKYKKDILEFYYKYYEKIKDEDIERLINKEEVEKFFNNILKILDQK